MRSRPGNLSGSLNYKIHLQPNHRSSQLINGINIPIKDIEDMVNMPTNV
jgi:hypothetical protein